MDFEMQTWENSLTSCLENACFFRVRFFINLEWILEGVWEVLGRLGGGKRVSKLAQMAIQAEIGFCSSSGRVLKELWGGYGRASGGFWKGLAEFLEGLGASWTLGALWVAGERAKRALRDMRFPFLGCILLHFVVLACFLLHLCVFFGCFFIFGCIWLLLRILPLEPVAAFLHNFHIWSRFPFLAKTGFLGGSFLRLLNKEFPC